MASPTEFLTKQVNIEKEIVTFRRLSRALSIHVNLAKNELASFHASSQATGEPVHATYLLTGEVAPVKVHGQHHDDMGMDVDDDESEIVSSTKILLVGESELEAAKATFSRIPSVHIYSLSPSAIRDAALIAPVADDVRQLYVTKGKEFHQKIGIVVGADVKVKTLASKKGKPTVAESAKPNTLHDRKLPDMPKSSHNIGKGTEKTKEAKKGALNWSGAKSKSKTDREVHKSAKEDEEKPIVKKKSTEKVGPKQQELKAAVKMESEESDVDQMKTKAPETLKRGKKRPSAVMSLSDSDDREQDDNPAPKTKPRASASSLPSKPSATTDKHVRVKNGAVISDEDTLDPKSKQAKKGKGKGRAILRDAEDESARSVRAMLDLDDSHFIRHNKKSTEPQAKEEEEDEGMISDSEPIPARAKPKRKAKKIIPVGRNGLPKKRVVKSKKSKDARGYMITQDYSSYESASDSERASVPQGSGQSAKDRRLSGKEKGRNPETLAITKPPPKPKSASESKVEVEDTSLEKSKRTRPDDNTKQDVKRVGAKSGGDAKSNSVKSSNNSKGNIMNYFGKK